MDTTEQLKKMYSAQLASQKEQLMQDYKAADANYAAEKEKAQKVTDANLTRTAVESQKAAVNNSELHNAYGLSSGTRAQARLAQENQLQADLTALRAQQQGVDADVERQRSLLAEGYQSAIRQAQADNDLAKAEALYEQAQREQEILLEQQKLQAQNELAQQQAQNQYALEYAKLMAEAGEYGPYLEFLKNQGVNVGDNAYNILIGETTTSTSTQKDSNTTTPTVSYDPNVESVFDSIIQQGQTSAGYKQVDTDATRSFKGSIMTRRELSRTGGAYGSYENYLATKIDEWLNSEKLTDDEAATLMQYYGLV